ncbi:hypothetical protein PIB30_118153 [Stylosanthes scabra]|uniref:PB1 domain-containing protein n=1 Tax=Stylosanthes scabra TaxID=79078 RepID=A0ABU6T459_9FABA|nr:hypothetical protein [Stylosanthes scabra]
MATKKVITICQSGGEFVTEKDGSLFYNGGDAYAIDIDQRTKLTDFKSEIAEMFNCSAHSMIIKYFLPGNNRTLITVSKDKDLQRMVSFAGEATTVDVFVFSTEEGAARNTSNMPASQAGQRRQKLSSLVLALLKPLPMLHNTWIILRWM